MYSSAPHRARLINRLKFTHIHTSYTRKILCLLDWSRTFSEGCVHIHLHNSFIELNWSNFLIHFYFLYFLRFNRQFFLHMHTQTHTQMYACKHAHMRMRLWNNTELITTLFTVTVYTYISSFFSRSIHTQKNNRLQSWYEIDRLYARMCVYVQFANGSNFIIIFCQIGLAATQTN